MQSKNVLWLGLLFTTLLIVFCIAKYIDQFNPNIKTITIPAKEIIDQNLELQPIKIKDNLKNGDVDENYLQIIKLVEQEEQDIEDAYNKALKEEEEKIKPPKAVQTKKIKKPLKKIKYTSSNKKSSLKKPKKLLIETVIDNQIITALGELSNYEKYKLKKLAQNLRQNPSTFLRIEASRKNSKIYNTKKYFTSLSIPAKKIQILYKRKKHIISTNSNDIEISVIKPSE